MDLINFKNIIDESLISFINKEKNTKIKEILVHSLIGGKRIRPIICLFVFKNFFGDIINFNQDKTSIIYKISLLPEIIHNISLIIDDLPCMDNDNYRRNKETTHFKFGIIPSYITIINLLNNIFIEFKNEIDVNKKIKYINSNGKLEIINCRNFIHELLILHLETLIEGQYYDLSFLNIKMNLEILYKINSKKTSPLFSLSFILGYIQIIHINPNFILEYKIIEELKQLGELFGLIFQLNDDILDREKDNEEGKLLNLSIHLGYDKSINIFNQKCEEFKNKLKNIKLWNQNFEDIIILLKKRIN